MKVFTDLADLPKFQNAVITIGSFDGIHNGHLKILQKLKKLALDVKGESIVITFHPHPRLVVYPQDNSLQLLTTIDEKIERFRQQGIDNLVIAPFTVEFSQLSADEYIEKFLVDRFSPSYIVIGYDHRFGLNRQGNIDYLRWHGERLNYRVVEIEKHEVDAIAVSSTKIRKALKDKQIRTANTLLGYHYVLSGKVVRGQRIGHQIGFPTANLEIAERHKLVPPVGIYAVEVECRQQHYQGMLYIGDRPTLEEYENVTIEVNIFDFDEDIYEEILTLRLVDFIREDQKYPGLEELSRQLRKDKESSLEILRNEKAVIKDLTTPAVGVVILNYNGRRYLETFLPSVLGSRYDNFVVWVADNGSTDDSVAWLKDNPHEDLRLLELGQNFGFAEGYNRALQQVEAEYYILLNSDIEVTENWIEPVIQLLERQKDVAACQPLIRSYHRRDEFEYAGAAGGWIDFLGYPFCRGRIFDVTEKDTGQYSSEESIFWASGAALFIRAKCFREIGGFDHHYFAHSEEIDLCWRLQRAGYRIMVQPASVVFHVGGGTLNYQTPRKTYLNFRNSLYTLTKNEPAAKLWWLLPARLFLDAAAGVLFFYQRKWDHITAIFRAHWTYFLRFRKVLHQRRKDNARIAGMRRSDRAGIKGRYQGSIVWQYYALGKKKFSDFIS